MSKITFALAIVSLMAAAGLQAQKEQSYNVESLKVNSGADSEKGTISITATISDPRDEDEEEKLIYALNADSILTLESESARQVTTVSAQVKNGKMKQLSLRLTGDLPVETVRGENIKAWSLQHRSGDSAAGERFLVVDLEEPLEAGSLTVVVEARDADAALPGTVTPMFYAPPDTSLSTGKLRVELDPKLKVEVVEAVGLDELDGSSKANIRGYNYTGGGQSLSLRLASKQRPDLHFRDFELSGTYEEGRFRFVVDGVAEVFNQGEFQLPLLEGEAALFEAPEIDGANIRFEKNAYYASFEKPGSYPVELVFDARVTTKEGRSRVRFDMMDSALQPVSLRGIPVDANRVTLNGIPMEESGGR